MSTVPFKQVDVFTSVPFKGNPLAVVFDADALSTDTMQAIARWTNLSETAFLLRPTEPGADYRVRIFTTASELPFAGHPTLGAAHALLESGYVPKRDGHLVQQCGVGLVALERQNDGAWAFAAPPARIVPLDAPAQQRLADALGHDVIDFSAPPAVVNNGVPWLVARVRSANACLALAPDPAAMTALTAETGAAGLAVYGPHDGDGPATFELRCICYGAETCEDPVTGSANAALACLLTTQDRRPGLSYTVRQGTVLGRDGQISVAYDDPPSDAAPGANSGRIWIGGHSVTVVAGHFRCA